jgi:hypothetical protein
MEVVNERIGDGRSKQQDDQKQAEIPEQRISSRGHQQRHHHPDQQQARRLAHFAKHRNRQHGRARRFQTGEHGDGRPSAHR